MGGGGRAHLDHAAVRDAAAAFALAAVKHEQLVIDLTGIASDVDARVAGQAVVEGVLMARYRYRAFVDKPSEAHLTHLTLLTTRDRVRALSTGADRGHVLAVAVNTARDLCNAPGTHLTARRYA